MKLHRGVAFDAGQTLRLAIPSTDGGVCQLPRWSLTCAKTCARPKAGCCRREHWCLRLDPSQLGTGQASARYRGLATSDRLPGLRPAPRARLFGTKGRGLAEVLGVGRAELASRTDLDEQMLLRIETEAYPKVYPRVRHKVERLEGDVGEWCATVGVGFFIPAIRPQHPVIGKCGTHLTR